MILALIRCELFIYEAQSLKDKRSVVKSVVTKIRQRCNVSIAETSFQDIWQRTELTCCAVGSSRKSVEAELVRALSLIDQATDAERTITDWEWI
ncbi:DUF503 domain-containing protein [Shouchella patagoniensis]|uniref:DUF503 domain-containing protein n=1 Tax=Shouchella patagoniensis TaxID=228576 RepID=UPI0015D5D026|nr:DUF503 domain-containing protein [Shouchella patagoniensis]